MGGWFLERLQLVVVAVDSSWIEWVARLTNSYWSLKQHVLYKYLQLVNLLWPILSLKSVLLKFISTGQFRASTDKTIYDAIAYTYL